jgi:peptidoglycan/xylan/chitin deacetylase (PgdA/CDA1 family)
MELVESMSVLPWNWNGSTSVALLYHDVVSREATDTSGVVTEGSWRYKLSPAAFEAHLRLIDESDFTPRLVGDEPERRSVYFTFDDGGRTATTAATLLEKYGFKGHFFIITDRIGKTGYLEWDQVEALSDAGHVVGSHTVSHANLLTADPERRRHELAASKSTIESRLGTCRSVSIPRGAHDKSVIAAASDIGYEFVFTSDPRRLGDGTLPSRIGRWNIWHDTGTEELMKILQGSPAYFLKTSGRWELMQFLKRRIGHQRFIEIRDMLL